MSTRHDTAPALSQTITEMFDLLPFTPDLLAAVGPFGLEPRLRQLAALAVSRAHACPVNESVHRFVGQLAGLTPRERQGDDDGLTAAERAAITVALGTVDQPPTDQKHEAADHYFSSNEIRQLQAVALSVRLGCHWEELARHLTGKPGKQPSA
jgi:alkylhydroperoxidase family enzyme